jgi:3-oxoacyl-[acyl-carrier protein] reductase
MPQIRDAFSLLGKVAVVTGASSGIGRAIACQLAAGGADVLVHAATDRGAADATAGDVTAAGRQASVELADFSTSQELSEFVERAWQWQQRVDIWVNNAGVDILTKEAAKWSFEEKLQRLWQVDVLATVTLSRLAGARMQARGAAGDRPVLLNMGWDQAEQGMEGDSGQVFSTAKGAVMAFTRSLAQSLAPQVRVNCLAPGWIKTSWGEKASGYWQQRACRQSLAQRWGTPDDVARVVRFLASPAADFLAGQVIPINGGFRYAN